MHDLTRWDGYAWRSGKPMRHDKQTTIADVIAYETEELGNDLYIFGDALNLLGHLPARKAIWVCSTRKAAAQYGDKPHKVELHGYIIASDPFNGFLVARD